MLRYVALLEKYSTPTSLQQLDMEIFKVRKALKQLHWKNTKLHEGKFSRKDIPSFSTPAAPQPSEMSLTDYQYLARTGLKLVSKHLNDRILREIERVPHQKGKFLELAFEISQREGRNYSMNQL